MSLVICSYNSLPQLRNNIHHWISQEYPDYELILVDDGSNDGTKEYLESFITHGSKIKYIHIPKGLSGKKQALLTAVSVAKNDWIALTDVDCKPAGKLWLQTMLGSLSSDTDLVMAYAPYERLPSLLNAFIRFESCLNAVQMLSSAEQGFPYAAIGRNLVYRKNLLTKEALQTHIPYGDDDLLVQYHSKTLKTATCMDPKGFCYTPSEKAYFEYFQRKRRHYATARTYSMASKIFLGLYYSSLLGIYLGPLVLAILGYMYLALILFLLKLLASWPLFCKLSRLFQERDLCKAYPFWELFYVCHIILQFPFLLKKRNHW